jgi:hemerythrin superfamily protein
MNALSVLKQDHGNVEALFKQFEALDSGDAVEKRRVVDHIIEQLSVHAAIEEQVFYPAVRQAGEEAADTVLEGLEEHHIVKWTLSELESLAPTDERFDAKVRVLVESVRHHVEEEEGELFEIVRRALGTQELEALGDALERAKETAPTRPHPRTPDEPPLNVLIGMPAAVMDKAFTTGKRAVERFLSRG